MPTYDYHCDGCEADFELFQSIMAKPIKKCPQCGAARARRLIGTGGAVIFKGSGFYATDYRSDSYRKAAEKDKPAAESDSTDTKSDKSSEKKPDAKKAKPDAKKESGD